MYFSMLHSETLTDFTKNYICTDGSVCNLKSTPSTESIKTLQSVNPMVENKELLVNPNCPIGIILDFISHEIGFEKSYDFDICELETGQMLGIKQYKPHIYGTNVFKPLQTYVVVFIERDEYGKNSKYDPLLSKQSRAYSEMNEQIQRALNPSYSKRSSAAKKRLGSSGSNVSASTLTRKQSVSPSHHRKSSSKQKN